MKFFTRLLALLCLSPLLFAASGSPVGARKPIICTTSCAVGGLRIGEYAIIIKGADTARVNNTSAADPDLVFTGLVAGGLYVIDENIRYNIGVAAAGFTFNNNLGTASITERFGYVVTQCNAANNQTLVSSGAVANNICTAVTGTVIDYVHEYILINAGGSYAFSWAQSTTNASATTLKLNSTMTITRLK